MRKRTIVLSVLGASLLIVVSVIAGLTIYLIGARVLTSSASYGYASPAQEILNENIRVVKDSVEWKLLSPSDDRDARISFKFTLHNSTSADIQLDVFQLKIGFFDAEGFALGRYNVTENITVPANGEFVYTETHMLLGGVGEQMAYIEVLGVRSKQ